MQDLLTVEQRNTRRLAKIHKLKRENRTLSSRRKELIKATVLDSKIWLNKISEQIGKNSAKIERLRTLINQDKAWERRPRLLDPRKIVYVE